MPSIGHNSRGAGSMFAIVFDLDTNSLKEVYGGPSWNNAYNDVRSFLKKRGFDWQQGSTYFGDDTVDAVTCVLAIQDMTVEFDWFAPSVRDIRMLRIEDNNDLMPAVERMTRRKAE
ncbi:virulence factor [Consotaella aegiceratis]|uniref:virulence factor n=1 Tax=Consotaella aegiceratis TaxID=3097961 RepID=UPI002F424942